LIFDGIFATKHSCSCHKAEPFFGEAAAYNNLNTMGGEQSSHRNGVDQQDTTAAKTCYYEVLGVERHATDEE